MGPPFSSPEAEMAALRADNARLRRLLDLTGEQACPPAAAQTGLFPGRAPDGVILCPHSPVDGPVSAAACDATVSAIAQVPRRALRDRFADSG